MPVVEAVELQSIWSSTGTTTGTSTRLYIEV